MEIGLDFNDKQYGECLGLRLSILDFGNTIIYGDNIDKVDIVVTDKVNEYLDNRIIYLSGNINDPLSVFSPSSRIYEAIQRKYRENTGVVSLNLINQMKSISFFSLFGGAGTSSISITFSRLLRLTGKNVMYITNTHDYFEGILHNPYSKIRLNYEIFKGENINIEEFIAIDKYSLSIIELSDLNIVNNVIEKISELNKYEYYVIDYGTSYSKIGSNDYMVVNIEDMRVNEMNLLDGTKVIINRCNEESIEGYKVPFDRNSFTVNNKIDIALDDKFSRSISKIVRDYLDEYK